MCERKHVVVDIKGTNLNAVNREDIVEVQHQIASVLSYKYKEYENYGHKANYI